MTIEEIACNLTNTAIQNHAIHYSENSAEDIADFFCTIRNKIAGLSEDVKITVGVAEDPTE